MAAEVIVKEASPVDAQFAAAVEFIQLLPKQGHIKPPIDDQLATYALFKQATIGLCNKPKPGIFHPIERLKWNAWNALGDMSTEEAKKEYVRRFIERCEGNYEKHSADLPDWLKEKKYEHIKPWVREKYSVFGVSHLKMSDGTQIDIITLGAELGLELSS